MVTMWNTGFAHECERQGFQIAIKYYDFNHHIYQKELHSFLCKEQMHSQVIF